MAFNSFIRLRALEDLKLFYENSLQEELKSFEARRKFFLRFAIAASIGIQLCYVAAILYWNREELASVSERIRELPVLRKVAEVGIFSLGIWFVCFLTAYSIYEYQQQKAGFKEKIIQSIIKFIDIDQVFSYSSHAIKPQLTERALNFGAILRKNPDKFSEEDCIYGTVDNISFCLSEVTTEEKKKRKIKSKNGPDRTETYYETLFNGLVLRAEFEHPFDFFLNIRSRGSHEQLPCAIQSKRFAGIDYSIDTNSAELVTLGSSETDEFSRSFLVYSDRPSEVISLLSTDLKEYLVQLKKLFRRDVFVSVNEQRAVIAIEYSSDLFEPVFFGSLLKFKPIREYFAHLELMFGVLSELIPD
ncbi:MAG: DUF3137 domain-containing protein [Leptolyngbyaceae cyanobacterium bins.59]|nr:DUF3137 domain-containing protein [Leptolyngbyaceae cyanobacterium bins.59]